VAARSVGVSDGVNESLKGLLVVSRELTHLIDWPNRGEREADWQSLRLASGKQCERCHSDS
jgi:hypothetical protein